MISALNPLVLDTSVLISSALFPGSIPDQAVACAFEFFDVVVSQPMLDELYASLLKPKHEQYASVTQRLSYFETFKLHATVVAVATTVTACRDAKDDKVLELAVSASVLIIVSGDRDLLTLNPFRGIEILTPRQFVAEFR